MKNVLNSLFCYFFFTTVHCTAVYNYCNTLNIFLSWGFLRTVFFSNFFSRWSNEQERNDFNPSNPRGRGDGHLTDC